MQVPGNNGHTIHPLESKTTANRASVTTEGGLARKCETLRRQNASLRKRLTAALADSGASKKALHQAQTFERIGRVAAGVAHDFTNFTAGIMGVVSEIHEDLGPQSSHRGILEMAMGAVQKACSLSKRLLSHGDPNASKQVLNLNHVIQEMSSMLRRLPGVGFELEILLDASLGNIRADQSQMEQVILNLAVNAHDAMPQGGTLTIKTCNVDSEARFGHRPSIKLEVSDTGVGMNSRTLRRIFEPFFTTKGPTKGTGIGLATLKGIIEEHDGAVSVESEPQHGSRFTILLPRVTDEAIL